MSLRRKTAIAEALEDAGYVSPRDRLDTIADEVIKQMGESGLTMDQARLEVYAKIGNDRDLLWELFTPWHDTAATAILDSARARRIAARKQSEAIPGASTSMPSSPLSGTMISEHARFMPSQRPSGYTAGGATTLRALERSRGSVAVISALNTEHINGKPIGEVTVREAIAWRATHGRRCRFIELITANMPLNFVIGEHVTPDEANAFLEQAKRETDNV